jgi:hypothetical protein
VKLAGAFLALIPLAFGGMNKVWEMRLGDLVKEPAGSDAVRVHPIAALAFSPDGNRLAVAIVHLRPPGTGDHRELTHILILDRANPEAPIRQFDLNVCPESLAWAPSGEAILLCGMVLRVADGGSCDALPPRWRSVDFAVWPSFTWIDSTHVLRADAILDTNCAQTGTWVPSGKASVAPGRWRIADIAAVQGWALVWHMVGARPNEFVEHGVADSKSGEWISAPSFDNAHPDQAVLVPGVGAWCGWDGKSPSCRNVIDSNKIQLGRAIDGYRFTNPAASAPRAIAERWGNRGFFCWECDLRLDRRAVWDFSTRTVISSWRPRTQTWNSIHRVGEPDRCAISPDGQFIAEGGDGVVQLHRLTP